MIYEYALEPALVARWHDRREFAFFEEKFGIKARRLISAYPKKKWKIMVWEEFRRGPSGNDQNAERNLSALLEWLFENSIKRQSSFECLPTWLERAEAEHGMRPFRAILATENPRNREAVIKAALLNDDIHALWNVPEMEPAKRRAEDLANAVAPLLRLSREIAFVDPNFDPTKRRFRDTLEAFCQRLGNNIHGLSALSIELHTSIERFFKRENRRNKEEENRCYQNLRRDCERNLPQVVPQGVSITVMIWREKERGPKIHGRYILCDPASILFGTGLDDEDSGDSDRYGDQTEDILFLTTSLHLMRRNEYCRDSRAFISVGDPFIIAGRKKST